MIPLRLVKNVEYHPFMLDSVYKFPRGFLEAFPEARVTPGRFIGVKRQALRAFRQLYGRLPGSCRFSPRFPRRLEASFAVLCGGDFAYCLPSALLSKRNYLYMFDAWPHGNAILLDWVKFFSIDKIFFLRSSLRRLLAKLWGSKKGSGFLKVFILKLITSFPVRRKPLMLSSLAVAMKNIIRRLLQR